MASTVSSPRPDEPQQDPIEVAPVALATLVEAGLHALMAPYEARVRIVEPGQPYDVGLLDPALVADEWEAPRQRPHVAISSDQSPREVLRARQWGVLDFVRSDVDVAELVSRIENVHRRSKNPAKRSGEAIDGAFLTPREAEIVSLVCRGKSNAEIATLLEVSPNSIKSLIRRAYRKMGVTSRAQAVGWGLARGY